ncbi:hypothetical protein PRNP1_001783 [Phytophthora ramorum]
MADAPPPSPAPPAPSCPPPSPPPHSSPPVASSGAAYSHKKPSKSPHKARRVTRTPPVLSLATPDMSSRAKGGQSSSFSSPLPPCPDDPPAPPPPFCTPPKYRPLEENEDEQDDARSVESTDESVEPQAFPTPPPPPSPPVTSPLGTPPPPPPPPFSPPSAKMALDLSGALETAVQAVEDTETSEKREESGGEDGDDEQEDAAAAAELAATTDASSSSVIASMRSAVREREIMATDTVRDVPVKKPRFYIGDIDNYSIIDKVGSGTYGEVFKCQHKVTKDIVALKKLRPDVEKNGFPVTSIREMKILKFLKHPNIVELKEIVSSSAPPKEGKRPPLYFSFEYMEHDLSGLLNHPRGKTEIEQLQLTFGLCGMPTEDTWPGFFKLPNAESFQMDDKYVCPLRERFKNFPPHAIDLLEKLLQLDPAKRITAAEAMDHDYFWRVQTCKPRDLPKFCVSSTHEYQSKKRHHEEMAAAAAANGGNAKGNDQHRNARQRGERSGYRERSDHYRSGAHHSRSDRSRPYRSHRPNSDYYDRDRDRSRSRSRERHRDRDHRDRDRER